MRFEFDTKNWTTITEGEKDCYLLANGLGGYSSLSVIGAAARGDQALLMSAKKAPNVRMHLVTNVLEKLVIDGQEHILTSQRMKSGADYEGFRYLKKFVYDDLDKDAPTWTFQTGNVTLTKHLLMVHDENTVAVKYEIDNPTGQNVVFEIIPLFRFTSKKEDFDVSQKIEQYKIEACDTDIKTGLTDKSYCIAGGDIRLYLTTNADLHAQQPRLFGEMYFSQDERDGRVAYGNAFCNCMIQKQTHDTKSDTYVILSTEKHSDSAAATLYERFVQENTERKEQLLGSAGLTSELGRQLVLSADAYVVRRESTNGKSIIAGYPFFEDWGRDTMISLAGATMVTGRFEECKSILRTFAKYVKNGLLPNLFPEGGENPMYNSADAPLLFVNAVYEYMEYSKDTAFAEEILPVLDQIISAYQNGTDFHIKMDSDGLIMAGAGLEQLTWMDVRVGDFLPTPRHGKPVEINAYWYSALMIMHQLTQQTKYQKLAEQVQASFLEKFWNEKEQCLKDVLSGGADENQIRCNQIWALTMPFTMLPVEKEALIIKKVKDELYTTVGLRTLAKDDPDFHRVYIGPMEERDRAYHQGTVWAFPLGAYYRACIRYAQKCADSAGQERIRAELTQGFGALTAWLKEGCVSQIAEIYDGDTPTVSRGCFAQAWSVTELLRAVYDFEKM
ncbi:MAG: amylo-alpha-1,6-glucosidase [Lachnospiraceae bacterium]|nr:amylo-alpha-1,6-glucosidase [Lachnospiraceae bacterium]